MIPSDRRRFLKIRLRPFLPSHPSASSLQVKHCAPSADVQGSSGKASEILFTILKATLAEYGVGISDLAGSTTDSSPDVKAMCTNILLERHSIPWDWCTCQLADEAADDALATPAAPQKSNHADARGVLKLVTKIAWKVNQSPGFKQRFEELPVETLDEVFEGTKHGSQRWLMSLVRLMERVISLWHVLRQLHTDEGKRFPLDNAKDTILQLYSLLEPLAAVTRDGRFGEVPMTAEVYLTFGMLHSDVLRPTMPLEVFDIPAAPGWPEAEQPRQEEREARHEKGGAEREDGKRGRMRLPSKMVPADQLQPVTVKTRQELRRALVRRFTARVWDRDSVGPSFFRIATSLLTPPFNTGRFLEGLRLSEQDGELLPPNKRHLAPTTGSEVSTRISESWTEIQARALQAARTQERRNSQEASEGQRPLKRFCAGDAGSQGKRRNRFASFGRAPEAGVQVKDGGDDSKKDLLADAVREELLRYQSTHMTTEEVGLRSNGASGRVVQTLGCIRNEGATTRHAWISISLLCVIQLNIFLFETLLF